ncbi:DUF1489 family protein [Ketogulonicigenium vulgare]|uniref:Lysophospholipase L1 and related esterase-like protein n=1 Tax=Ketogulonicigenium vulgare (strain WSH-001) TaxID=759362 RepID=F9Y3C7_KETVW|nr:DUF1489 domain-containing protein [Ketogulonicigenium vulgare]AEM40368.1 Lysophospholipase L1 and related esterase-like protein [Ketogulonicigenium vulgare WSH-001]ALJ80557.1 lysophospholipase [Ketogulonicigenium vulgare]ANW33378.1 lysophospholipase [Ketogulonicigenium vulgare]AOZ54081.1 Lysophospholipase L1 and related esterase-like protein [Ketogulonicigenium vulgare]
MAGSLNIIKLSVGTEDVGDLAAWQSLPQAQTADGLPRHITRMWPKREAEILSSEGSVYWVIKGVILCRQKLVRFDRVTGSDGIERCAMVLEPELIRVTPTPRRPFQGWRYFAGGDAPADLDPKRAADDALPPKLSAALAEFGVI